MFWRTRFADRTYSSESLFPWIDPSNNSESSSNDNKCYSHVKNLSIRMRNSFPRNDFGDFGSCVSACVSRFECKIVVTSRSESLEFKFWIFRGEFYMKTRIVGGRYIDLNRVIRRNETSLN
jgi:hypothetical protein